MSFEFNRSNIDHYLYLVAKEYKKQNRLNPEAEIIMVGGAAMIMKYNFRDKTTDIDALIRASSTMKDIVNKIGDENNLTDNWLNDDFKNTASYSPKILECSKFYKRFCNCLNVRTISDEYLLAMKLRSNREYKRDRSDIIGIIKEHHEMGKDFSFDTIKNAYQKLYNEELPKDQAEQIISYLKADDLEELFYNTIEEENRSKSAAKTAEQKYPGMVNENNISSFIRHFKEEEKEKDPGIPLSVEDKIAWAKAEAKRRKEEKTTKESCKTKKDADER